MKTIKRSIITLTVANFLIATTLFAQKNTISGTVSDEFGPLPGANVIIKGTFTGTSTNVKGEFSFEVEPGEYTLQASYVMYAPEILTVKITLIEQEAEVNFVLKSANIVDEIVVVGSRAKPRSLLETAVPVDIISLKDITNSSQTEIGQILQYIAPSFHSAHQTISDGTDHVDPATLRGLGPDQVLVLINGKRRHSSSLINVNGTVGRGTVGTDLNAIPTSAIARIEILRDGAAAQYGSDAIAGVINIVLKEQTGIISASTTMGINKEGDGLVRNANISYGIGMDNGGFISVAAEFTERGSTNRSGDYTGNVYSSNDSLDAILITQNDFWNRTGFEDKKVMEIGNSATTNGGFFFNAAIPLKGSVEFYSNGGFNARKGKARGFYRFPKDENKVVLELYPHGFSPEIHTDVIDHSFTAGLRGEKNGWNTDFSNSQGGNQFDFTIKNSNNASLGTSSPTTFYAGGFQYSQNTSNLDLSKKFESIPVISSLNVAFGAEFRLENYQINPGEEASWIDGGDTTSSGGSRVAGAQVFPGFQPQNELNKNRTNTAAYLDLEVDITSKFLIGAAARYELYSDFGDNISWKATARYKITKGISVRGAYSTGFRAPSLHQIYFNNLSTQFISGVAYQVGTFNNESVVTKAFGIDPLKPEISNNISIGATAKLLDNLSLTVDAYQINIKDRIVLSGRFDARDGNGDSTEYTAILEPLGAGAAQFFTNAIDTKTQGIDVVFNYLVKLGLGRFSATLAANFNQTKVVGNIKTPSLLTGKEDVLYNREEISRMEVVQPKSKINLLLIYELKKLQILLRNTRFGEVEYINPGDGDQANWTLNELNGQVESRDQVFSPKIITDLSIAYKITRSIKWTIGANNLFDVYPDEHDHSGMISSGRFVYSRRVQQFGVNGSFYYTKVSFSL